MGIMKRLINQQSINQQRFPCTVMSHDIIRGLLPVKGEIYSHFMSGGKAVEIYSSHFSFFAGTCGWIE